MTQSKNYSLYLAVSVDAQRYTRVNGQDGKLAPGGYAIQVPELMGDKVTVGQGFVSNSEALFAHAICAALDEIFPANVIGYDDDGPEFILNVIANNTGSKMYLEKYVPAWLANPKCNAGDRVPNNFDVWKRCYLLSSLGRLVVTKATGAATHRVRILSKTAKDTMRAMRDCSPNDIDGLI